MGVSKIGCSPGGLWKGDLCRDLASGEPFKRFRLDEGETMEDAIAKSKEMWPKAEIHIWSECGECHGHGVVLGEEETYCEFCNGFEGMYTPLSELEDEPE